MAGFVINEDNSHYYYDRGLSGVNEEKMREMAQHYCRGQAVEVIYNLNSMRSSVAGLPFEPIWYEIDDRGKDGLYYAGEKISEASENWILSAKKQAEIGLDPYIIWIDETRKLGRRAGISIRMNDIHEVDNEKSFMHSEMWRKHPEFRRERGGLFHGWDSAALDFSQAEIREYSLNMVLSVLNRYDMDTLELDWMRFGHSFRPGFEDEGRKQLTDFHMAVKQAATKREKVLGHQIEITVRCPAHPEEAFNMGYDVIDWANKKLIDRVTPTPFFTTTDFEIPISLWRRLLPDSTAIDAGLEIRIQAANDWNDYIMESPDTLCALAANYLSQGADRIYLFNHMDSQTSIPYGYNEIFSSVGNLQTAAAHKRRHIVTFSDRVSCGSPMKPGLPLYCPSYGSSDYLRADIGPKPEQNRSCELIIGISDDNANLTPVMNDAELPLPRMETPAAAPGKNDDVFSVYSSIQQYPASVKTILRFDASRAVKSGRNVFWFKNNSDQPCEIRWAEIQIGQK